MQNLTELRVITKDISPPGCLSPAWFRCQWQCLSNKNHDLVESWTTESLFGFRLRNCWLGIKIFWLSLFGRKFLGWKPATDLSESDTFKPGWERESLLKSQPTLEQVWAERWKVNYWKPGHPIYDMYNNNSNR